MLKALVIFAAIYLLMLLVSYAIETAEFQKPLASVRNGYKRLLLRSLVYFGMIAAATSIIYLQYTLLVID